MQRAQSGQVLTLGVLVLFCLVGVVLHFYYVGQISIHSVRQRHALDAATYSGAVLQSQSLNYAAYLNKAYAAHQIAMAHLITMASWAQFAANEAIRVNRANPPASLIAMMFGPQHGVAYQAATAAAATTGLAATDVLHRLFQQHQRYSSALFAPHSVALYNELPAQREWLIRQVLQANYPEFSFAENTEQLVLTIEEDQWQHQLAWAPASSWRPWVQELTQHYGFLQPRHYTAKNQWLVQARCPHKRHELRRRGHTVLTEQGQWQAQDTQAFHALRANRWIGCYFREYPMGWAWVEARSATDSALVDQDQAPADFSQQDFWRWVQANTRWDIAEGSSNALSRAWALRDAVQWQGQGLANYLMVAATPTQFSFKTHLRLRHAPEQPAVHSTSQAQSYFQRPVARSDQLTEKNNLFHPFWQARLIQSQWNARLQQLLGD